MSMLAPYRFCVAPMMEWTDRHCRAFHRLMTRHTRLYTEMLTTGAVLHGDKQRLLGFSPQEQPVALQLGGSDPQDLAEAAKIGVAFGYSEINLNVGCPSDRVQNGRFGACLMAEPQLVAASVAAMRAAVKVPVTVKCRIGIDAQDAEASLDEFIRYIVDAGVDAVIVHARKAWLKGLSPKDNRTIPPLNYERVYRLKQKFSGVPIVINGGIATLEEAVEHLKHVDGVMMGRAAYHEPWRLLNVDPVLFDAAAPFNDAFDIAKAVEPYLEAELEKGVRLHNMTRHMLMLFQGRPGGRQFRRVLAEEAVKPGAGLDVWRKAVAAVENAAHRFDEIAA